jgi:hypothetical protein
VADTDFFGDGAIGLAGAGRDGFFRTLTGGHVRQAAAARRVGKRSAALAS